MAKVIDYLKLMWLTRKCQHRQRQPIYGDERSYGYRWHCVDCGKPVR